MDKRIEEQIAASALVSEAVEFARAVPGVGPAVSSTLLAFLPELGTLSRRPNASPPWSLPHGRTACPTTACSRPGTGSATGSFPCLPPTPRSGPG